MLLLRSWHRAFLLGLEIRKLSVNGKEVSSTALDCLNMWISAHGAWRCSTLPHWEALAAIEHVLFGHPLKVRPGKAGGGRVARLAESDGEHEEVAAVKPDWSADGFSLRKRGRRRNPLRGKAAAEEMAAFDRSLGLK